MAPNNNGGHPPALSAKRQRQAFDIVVLYICDIKAKGKLTVDALLSAFDECYPLGDDSLFQRSANLKKQIMESIKRLIRCQQIEYQDLLPPVMSDGTQPKAERVYALCEGVEGQRYRDWLPQFDKRAYDTLCDRGVEEICASWHEPNGAAPGKESAEGFEHLRGLTAEQKSAAWPAVKEGVRHRGCSYKQIVQHGVTRGYWFKPGTPDSDSKISQRLSTLVSNGRLVKHSMRQIKQLELTDALAANKELRSRPEGAEEWYTLTDAAANAWQQRGIKLGHAARRAYKKLLRKYWDKVHRKAAKTPKTTNKQGGSKKQRGGSRGKRSKGSAANMRS